MSIWFFSVIRLLNSLARGINIKDPAENLVGDFPSEKGFLSVTIGNCLSNMLGFTWQFIGIPFAFVYIERSCALTARSTTR